MWPVRGFSMVQGACYSFYSSYCLLPYFWCQMSLYLYSRKSDLELGFIFKYAKKTTFLILLVSLWGDLFWCNEEFLTATLLGAQLFSSFISPHKAAHAPDSTRLIALSGITCYKTAHLFPCVNLFTVEWVSHCLCSTHICALFSVWSQIYPYHSKVWEW